MREESHLDDMRQAIRGDFERLAARRGDQELMRVADLEPPGERIQEEPPVQSIQQEEEPTEEQLEEQPEQEPAPDHPRKSWLSRMFST